MKDWIIENIPLLGRFRSGWVAYQAFGHISCLRSKDFSYLSLLCQQPGLLKIMEIRNRIDSGCHLFHHPVSLEPLSSVWSISTEITWLWKMSEIFKEKRILGRKYFSTKPSRVKKATVRWFFCHWELGEYQFSICQQHSCFHSTNRLTLEMSILAT